MKIWSNFHFSGIFYDLVNLIAYGIGYFFKIVLDAMNDFAIEAYKFMSFSGSSTIKGLYDVISKFIWIPVLLCGLIMCIRIIMGDIIKKNVGKQFIRNLCYLFVAVVILPSVFSYLNNSVLDENYFSDVSGAGRESESQTDVAGNNHQIKKSLSDDILRSNSKDRLWLYNRMLEEGGAFQNIDQKLSAFEAGDGTAYKMMDFTEFITRWNPALHQLVEADKDLIESQKGSTYYGEEMSESAGDIDLESVYKTLNSSEVHKEWAESSAAQDLSFNYGSDSTGQKVTLFVHNNWKDATNAISSAVSSSGDSDSGSNGAYTEGVPNFFKVKVCEQPTTDGSTAGTVQYLDKLSDGTDLLGLTNGVYIGKESYWRYDIKWINVYIELIAHAYVFFVVGFCAVKLIIELIVHQVFGGMMAAMDLSGGDRMKKYFTAIIGCYMGLLIGAMVIPLYSAGCDFITNDMNIDSSFVQVILKVVLAFVIVNVPNIIAMYFGVNTGAGAGGALIGAGTMLAMRTTGRAARGAFRGVSNTRNRNLENAREKAAMQHTQEKEQHAREREQLADQRYAAQQANNASQAQHAQERENMSDQRNERQDLSDNAGLSNISDEAHGRNSSFDQNAEKQRQEALSSVAAEAEKNGGSRQAYMNAAENTLKSNGAFKPTQETISYAADAAKMQKESANINAIADEKLRNSGNTISTTSARGDAAREVLKDWGASDQNISAATAHNYKAENLPKRNDNANLKT
jgi:hypothetical protein